MPKKIYHIIGDQGAGKTGLAKLLANALEQEGCRVAVLENELTARRQPYARGEEYTHFRDLDVEAVVITHDIAAISFVVARPGEHIINVSLAK